MSGTSLDGLDLCLARFEYVNNTWKYEILASKTVIYSEQLYGALSQAAYIQANLLVQLDYSYGKWIGSQAKQFISKCGTSPDVIASHGHTVFHNPKNGYSLQIGKGAAIAAITGIPCISDFRSTDICLGGQGAPLVPIGDKLLFSEFDFCLNLGGIANISYNESKNNERVAFDICPCNMALNYMANKIEKPFDKNGEIGKTGKVIPELLEQLNLLKYYQLTAPKSLSREWFESEFLPIIENGNYYINDVIRTIYEHIAIQISISTQSIKGSDMLLTGGGTHNKLLVKLIREKVSYNVVVPEQDIVDYKEALVFAFLGVLYLTRQVGALASVTGAERDSIIGGMYL